MQTREQQVRSRDTQRKRAYMAESAAGCWQSDHLGDISATRGYVLRVLNSKRMRVAFPFMYGESGSVKDLTVRSNSGCNATDTVISLTVAGRCKMVVLHELAHVLKQREDYAAKLGIDPEWRTRKGYRAAHGWRWAMIYLRLVLWFIGRDAHDRLKREFKSHRVRFRPPRHLTSEQRLALANRLRRMRGDPILLKAAA